MPAEFIITTVVKVTVPDGPNAEAEAIKQWNDVAWRHHGVQTADDLRRVLKFRIAEVGKGRGFSRENMAPTIQREVESAALKVAREAGC